MLAGSTLYAGGLADGGWIDLNSGAGTAGTIFVGSMNKAAGGRRLRQVPASAAFPAT